MTRMLIAVGVAAALALSCSKSENKPEPAPEAKPTRAITGAKKKSKANERSKKATAQTAGEPETKIADGEVPTQEDYEEEASNKMASANLEVELDALEAEIGN
jgi:hypothetical protein